MNNNQRRIVNINASNSHGYTALMDAAKNRDLHTVKTLATVSDTCLKQTDDIGKTALDYACYGGNYDIIQFLTSMPLIRAVQNNDLETVRELLKHEEIKVNIKDSNGKSALDYAISLNHDEIEKAILGD